MIKLARNIEGVIESLCNIHVTDNNAIEVLSLGYANDSIEDKETDKETDKGVTFMLEMAVNKQVFELKENADPLTDETLATILADNALSIALINADKRRASDSPSMDIDLTDPEVLPANQKRRLISRVLAVSNIIAVLGRQGPATIVMAHTDVIRFFKGVDGSDGPSTESSTPGGFTYIAYDACNDNVVVARKSEHTAALVRHNEDVLRYVFIRAVNEKISEILHTSFKVKLN